MTSAVASPSEKKREPVLLAMSILGALQFFVAGASGISFLADNETLAATFALAGLAVAAATFGVQFWVRGQVTPVESVTPVEVKF